MSDNGSGVPPASRPLMAMKHATSKLRQFDDLYHQDDVLACAPTLGFRGEALFCLANLSRSLAVSTRCRDSDGGDPLGEQFSFDVNGNLIESSRQRSARPIGTAVTVRGLFECLPVRRVDFCKRIRGQRAKLIKMMQGCEFARSRASLTALAPLLSQSNSCPCGIFPPSTRLRWRGHCRCHPLPRHPIQF